MAMKLASMSGGGTHEVLMEVNTTPLIDVMLVLLVMLIVTIPMQLHSIPLSMGADCFPMHEPVAHEVAIDFDGTVYWDQTLLAGAGDLDAKLSEVSATTGAHQPEVHIRPHKLSDYGAVAAVMAAVQRHGIKTMGMIGNERFAR